MLSHRPPGQSLETPLPARRPPRVRLRLAACCLALICLGAGGCRVGPDFVPPEAPQASRYTAEAQPTRTDEAGGQAQSFAPGAGIPADWWRLFSSTRLEGLLKQALAHNPTLQAAQASLRQSQANLRAGYGVFYPQVDSGLAASRQQTTPAALGGQGKNNIFNLVTLNATVSYALDVFGGQRRAVEGLEAQVEQQRQLLRGAHLALTGNLVNAVIARAAYRQQISATRKIIELRQELVRISEAQERAGTVPRANVLSLQSQLAASQATLPALAQKESQAGHLIATLAGSPPAQPPAPPLELAELTLPADLPLSLPSQLARQRPDILAAEAQLHAASANVGVATAALYPSFTLTGMFGLQGNALPDLYTSQGGIWNLGAGLSAPLLHGGTLEARREAAQEAYNQALALYRKTVLDALAQVADTLRGLEHDAQLQQAQEKALSTSQEALRLLKANYQAGTVNYLQVLNASDLYQQAQMGLIQAQAQRLQDSAALLVALGGGWWHDQKAPPAPQP